MLRLSGIAKSFGSVKALSDVSVEFSPGEVHAVLGENGAGKSTLMHVAAGFLAPDAGDGQLDGVSLPFGRPFESRKMGIEMIHQHFTLVPGFTVEENLALSRLVRLGPIDRSELSAAALDQAKSLGWSIDPKERTSRLGVGGQQRLEILKAITGNAKIVIFDEPTAVLSPEEVADLFSVLRRLKGDGKSVILIAHKLQEVMAIADRVTVLRKGRVVAQEQIGKVTPRVLAEWMVGELPPNLNKTSRTALTRGLEARALSAKGDRGQPSLTDIDLDVRRGEILGVGGVDGNGQIELAEVLAGVRRWTGSLQWEGSPIQALRRAYIPQDRQTDGLALSMSIADNLLVEGQRRKELTFGPFIRPSKVRRWASRLAERFDVVTPSTRLLVSSLSGGNQQKVVIARALDETPELLVASNPTRGLDVKATEYVHRQILGARDSGAAVVLISTDLDELAALASRTIFLSRGRIVTGEGASALVGGES